VEQNEEKTAPSSSMLRSFSNADKVRILDHLHEEAGDVRKQTVRWVRENWNRPTFQSGTLRNWIRDEATIRGTAGRVRRIVIQDRQAASRYPKMETALYFHVKKMRAIGLPVETWMLSDEVKLAN
jgi:hypothetical protein